jgi:hypothetical protein
MGLVLVLVVLALIIGGIGLAVKAVWWLLIIGVILLVVGALVGLTRRTA